MSDFEQGLTSELQGLAGFTKKVFPVTVPEGTSPPYVIYAKTRGDLVKTLDAISKVREITYEIDIVSKTYADLQLRFVDIKNKVTSMVGRNIGTTSVYVQNVTFQNIVELFEREVRWYRINMEIKFYYEGA